VTRKLTAFFLEQSFKIMISGFVITSAGMLLFIKMQHKNLALEKTALAVIGLGIGFWLIGRIGIVLQNRRLRKKAAREAAGPET
jgi:hypothetical protein